MNQRDYLELCARNLLRRRTRTVLAVVGVVVGTCAIIVMLSIGFGLSESFQKQIESYGNLHLITVYPNESGRPSPTGGGAGDGKITDQTILEMEKMKGVDAVTPVISEYLVLGVGKSIAQIEIQGIRPEVLEKFNYQVQEGRLLSKNDKMGILFGSQIPNWFYNPKQTSFSGPPKPVDVITDKMILTGDMEYGQPPRSGGPGEEKPIYKEYKVKGIGLLANPSDESAYSAYMNIEELAQIRAEVKKARKEVIPPAQKNQYSRAMIYAGDIDDVEDISKALREKGYQTHSANDWLEAMKQTARMIQGILGGIGCISLFVAALGITNTMIMSIYERTREIGIMKVIGANLPDIRRMFLVEAGMIGGIGGAVGVLFSYILSFAMNTFLGSVIGPSLGIGDGSGTATISIIPWWVALAALVFAILIGVAAGYYPARRAMNLSALESLRNE